MAKMVKYEVGYKGKDGKGHKFTFKTDRVLRQMGPAQHYGIAYPFWEDMMRAIKRIQAREGTTMNRVGFGYQKYIKNTETGHTVYFA